MLVKNMDILVSSIEEKVNNNTKLPYLAIGIMTLDDGTNFNVLERNTEKFGLYQPMQKYRVNLKVSSSQYGINVSIEDVLKDLGNILTQQQTVNNSK